LWFPKKIWAILVVGFAKSNNNFYHNVTTVFTPNLYGAAQQEAALYGFSGPCQIDQSLADTGLVRRDRRKLR
jgi:hypothetical protein